jgi:cytochrome c-type biogenesis protein CcmH
MMLLLRWPLFILLLCLAQAAPCAAEEPLPIATSAHEIESHLFAPCCWRETLDIHQSPIATELRAEIRSRLAKGETAASIERTLMNRYGQNMRATLPEHLGYILFSLVAIGGLLTLAWLFIRRNDSARAHVTRQVPSQQLLTEAERKRFEEQLDDDLA